MNKNEWNKAPQICACCQYSEDKDSRMPDLTYCKIHKMEVKKGKIWGTCSRFTKRSWANKYNAQQMKVDGIRFDSKKEAERYAELKLMQKNGDIKYFHRQPIFDMGSGVKYRADFLIVDKNNRITYEDVKGYKIKEFIRCKKLVEDKYPIEIIEIKK